MSGRDLIDLYLNGELTPEQAGELEAWLAQNDENVREFVRETHAHGQTRALVLARKPQEDFGVSTDATASGLTQVALEEDAAPKKAKRRKASRRKGSITPMRIWPALLAAGIAAAVLLYVFRAEPPLRDGKEARTIATLIEAQAGTTVRRDNQELRVQPGLTLKSGDELRARPDLGLKFRFDREDTLVSLAPGSALILNASAEGKRLKLIRGEVAISAAPQRPEMPLVVETTHATATVIGTVFSVSTDDSHSRLEVQRGKVRFASAGQSVDVGTEQYALAAPGIALKANPILKPKTPAPGLAVLSFTLINTDNRQPVPGFEELKDGAVLNLKKLPTRNLSIRANTQPLEIGSVLFSLNESAIKNLETVAPYALSKDLNKGDYRAWTPPVGTHTLTATPYDGKIPVGTAKPAGNPGRSHTITFHVIDR